MVMRWSQGMCGTLAVRPVMMTMCSCRTWLCATLARRASGVVWLFGCGNTAVPGTRGRFCLRISAMKASSGPSLSARRAVTSWRPRCQVSMTVNTMAAMSRVSQPPWVILVRLAAK